MLWKSKHLCGKKVRGKSFPHFHRLPIKHACGNVENSKLSLYLKRTKPTTLLWKNPVQKIRRLLAQVIHYVAHDSVKVLILRHQGLDFFDGVDDGRVMLSAELAPNLWEAVFG
jgi:hypothetical protein